MGFVVFGTLKTIGHNNLQKHSVLLTVSVQNNHKYISNKI